MKYPEQYFCGSGAQIYPREVFLKSTQAFSDQQPMPPTITGETGIDGLLIDFNYGLRLQIPEGNWHVRIVDADSEYVFFDDDISAVTLISVEKYYIEWEIAIWLDGEPVFYHQFDPRGQHVHFKLNRAIGDNITLLPYIEAFRQKFDCTVSCSVSEPMKCLVQTYFPDVTLTKALPEDAYACFYMSAPINMPFVATDHALHIPLLELGHSILRRIAPPPKKIYTPTKPRSIDQKYVCIGVQASTPEKSWLNPEGWDHVVDYLKSLGYRVLCIDRDRVTKKFGLTVEIPRGAENFSGKYDLLDRVNQLAYADFFIGVSSGLSWLAWSVDIPVVMISGITARWYEFQNPYRIYNPVVCHGCFNEYFGAGEKNELCLLFKGTDRAYECSKNITARQVINAIDRLIADHNLGDRDEK